MRTILLDPDSIRLLPINFQGRRGRTALKWALSSSSLPKEDSRDLLELLHSSGDQPFWFDGGINGDIKTPVKVGRGDGRRAQFFLPSRHVFASSLVVRVDETIESGWTLDEPSSLLTFAIPPAAGALITAIYRCRFECILSVIEKEMIIEEIGRSPDANSLDIVSSFRQPGLIGPDGRPISQESQSYRTLVTDVRVVSDKVLRELARRPEVLWKLSPRTFEEIIAEIFSRQGYEVTLTPASRDGGKDIYAATKTGLGSFLYIVECKKYSPDKPIGVGLVRSLYGVVEAEKATAGIMVTTSYFTRDAKELRTKLQYRISLQDFIGIKKWLMDLTKNSTNSMES